MVIGFDGSRAFSADRTGTENYSYQLLKALAKIDRKNQYIVYLRSASKGLTLQGWPENFQFKVIKWPRLWTQLGLAKQTFHDQLDVLIIPAHTSPLFHKPGFKTVVTVHDLGAEYLPKMHQLKQRLYLKWITHYQLKSASKLIAVSEATKQDLVKRVGIDPKKVEIVYEGYDEKLFGPVKGDALVHSLKQFGLQPCGYFLFVGTVQPRKNLERLIRAFSMCVSRGPAGSQPHSISSHSLRGLNGAPRSPSPLETKLIIVGSRGWMADSIYNLPRKLGIEDEVKFLGRVDDKDLPALYSGAIALTFPSLFEGFGLPILEAQACGCPVLTSNVSSMPEVAGKGALFVDPDSTDSIIEGIRGIVGIREELIEAGFKNVRKFSWEKCARQTLEVLESV